MNADTLARIAAAIDADSATEAANWPLSRERTRKYIALARAVVAKERLIPAPDWSNFKECIAADDMYHIALHKLAALAPDADAGE